MDVRLRFLAPIVASAVVAVCTTFPGMSSAVEGAHPIGNQLVPLPAGEWQVVASTNEMISLRAPAGSARMGSLAAVLARDDQVVAMVVARANLSPVQDGFGMTDLCRRSDLYSTRNDTPSGSLIGTCQFVGHAIQDVGPGSASVWVAAVADAGDRKLKLPVTWLVAGFRVADDQDVLDVQYLFNPEVFGLSDEGAVAAARGVELPRSSWPSWPGEVWSTVVTAVGYPPTLHDPRWIASSWTASRLEAAGQRELLVRHLVHWADTARPWVQAGFKNRSNGRLPMPRAWASDQAAAGARNSPVDSDTERLSAQQRAIWKTLTWRSVGSGLDALVAYVLTGSAGVAGAITVVGGAVNATAYFMHEVVWDVIGARKGPGDRTTELPPVAVTQ